jgi:hypothetical protein
MLARLPRMLLAAIAGLSAADADAICPRPEPKVCSAYFDSDQVFLGRVTRVERLEADPRAAARSGDVGWLRYTMQVERHIKGRVGKVERLLSEDASARWDARVGERRLVFVRAGEVHATCGPLDHAASLPAALAALRALARARSGTIEGEVVARGPDGLAPVAGHRIEVRGTTGVTSAITDAAGRFRIVATPGRYAFEPALPAADPIESRDDTDGFTVGRGECAQFRLSTTRRPP